MLYHCSELRNFFHGNWFNKLGELHGIASPEGQMSFSSGDLCVDMVLDEPLRRTTGTVAHEHRPNDIKSCALMNRFAGFRQIVVI